METFPVLLYRATLPTADKIDHGDSDLFSSQRDGGSHAANMDIYGDRAAHRSPEMHASTFAAGG